MEAIQPYLLGWLIQTLLSAVVGYLAATIKRMRADSEEGKEMQEFILLTVCRLAIYADHFSIDEKVDAYRTYRAHGGNHQTKKYMDELLGEDADAYLARHE